MLQFLSGYPQDEVQKGNDLRNRYELYKDQLLKYQKNYAFDTSGVYADSMIMTAHELADIELLAQAIRRKGLNYKKAGELDSALAYLFKSRDMSLEHSIYKNLAASETIIGNIFKSTGESDSAMHYQLLAIEHYTLAQDSLGIAFASNNLGSVYKSIDELDEALTYFLRCEEIYQQLGENVRVAYVQLNIGNIYLQMGEYEKAIQLYNKCYEVSKANENYGMIITSLTNLGNAYTEKDMLVEAESTYLEAIELRQTYQNDRSLALIKANLAFVYADLEKEDLAYQYIIEALDLAREAEVIKIEVQCLNYLGIYHKNRGETRLAEQYYREAIQLAEDSEFKEHLSDAYINLSSLLEAKGDLKNSFRYYKLYKATSDSMLNETKVRAITELQAKYEKKEDEARILQLQNEAVQAELKQKNMRIKMNAVLGTGISLVLLLLMGLLFYRLKSRKDRIISQQKIQQLEDEKKLLAAQSVMVGQEKERARVAQELHDSIGVLLSTAKIHFSNVVKNTKDDKTLALVRKADKLLKDAGEEVREISHNIMPGVLSKFGLSEAIEDLLDEVSDSGKLQVDFDVFELKERLPENTEIMLYRVLQELVNNTLKHAEASNIKFIFRKSEHELYVEYSDNGIGFDPDNLKDTKSMGISGIRSRVDFLKGKLDFTSSKKEGTIYKINIPV